MLFQPAVPIRAVAIDRTSSVPFAAVSALKVFSNRSMLVNDGTARMLVLLDSNLARVITVADTTGATPLAYGRREAVMVGGAGDSVLITDSDTRTFVVIGMDGKQRQTVAVPVAAHFGYIAAPNLGAPFVTSRGSLIYRTNFYIGPGPIVPDGQPRVSVASDSAPLLRASFDTRVADTVAKVRIPRYFTDYATTVGAIVHRKMVQHPVTFADAWTVLSDGTVAIVRSHDYHVDWIDPNGSTRSTPKLPFEWRRLTDAEKQHIADTALARLRVQRANMPPPLGGRGDVPEFVADTPNEIPDYISPVGGVWPDADGRIWILPTLSSLAKGGKLYDVVNTKGELVERVQLPAGAEIAGFGAGGVVYLTKADPTGGRVLERARLKP